MPTGLPGADSTSPVSSSLIAAATALFGSPPAFWGRYFGGPYAYDAAQENAVLAANGIRLLPVADQTDHVGGSSQQGDTDAEANVSALFTSFSVDHLAGLGGQFLVILDVEGTPDNGNPSLALDYYLGWAEGLARYSQSRSGGTVALLPAVYARQGDEATWNVLSTAAAQGVACHGAWVARYHTSGCNLLPWDSEFVQPAVTVPCDLLLWQFQQDCCNGEIDCDQANPSLDVKSLLLDRLILPPG